MYAGGVAMPGQGGGEWSSFASQRSRAASPCATTPRRAGTRSPASTRGGRWPLAVGDVNLSDKDRYAMMMAARKQAVEREHEFKLRHGDVGPAELQMRGEMRMELERQQALHQQQHSYHHNPAAAAGVYSANTSALHTSHAHAAPAPSSVFDTHPQAPHPSVGGYTHAHTPASHHPYAPHSVAPPSAASMNTSGIYFAAPPLEMANNRYQKLYEDPSQGGSGPAGFYGMGMPPASQVYGAGVAQRWGQAKKLKPLDEDEKSVVKRCIRCVVESAYINNAGDFKQRLGFYRGDLKRLYETLCRDTSDWSHYDVSSNYWVVINNCMHEVINNNICTEWGRWFGNVSRRRLDNLYIKLEGCGRMLQRGQGA